MKTRSIQEQVRQKSHQNTNYRRNCRTDDNLQSIQSCTLLGGSLQCRTSNHSTKHAGDLRSGRILSSLQWVGKILDCTPKDAQSIVGKAIMSGSRSFSAFSPILPASRFAVNSASPKCRAGNRTGAAVIIEPVFCGTPDSTWESAAPSGQDTARHQRGSSQTPGFRWTPD